MILTSMRKGRLLLAATLVVPLSCGKDEAPPASQSTDELPFGERRGIGSGDPRVSVPLGDEAVGPDLLQECVTASGPSRGDVTQSLVIDDFDDGDNLFAGNGLAGAWFPYGDGTGSQTPGNFWLPEPGGRTEVGHAAHIVGGGFEEWGSGNGIVIANSTAGQLCLFDASMYDGITFWARGQVSLTHPDDPSKQPAPKYASVLRVQVVELDVVPEELGGPCQGSCWDSHRVSISLEECWKRYVIPFSELEQDGFG